MAQTIVLDHAKKTARIQSNPPQAPPHSGMPHLPQMAAPTLTVGPHPSAATVEDLGKRFLDGHEVEGKRFTTQPPAEPNPASMKPRQNRGRPILPATAGAPTVAEVWSSTSMRVPMLTKLNSSSGDLTQVCRSAVPGEPHPTTFEIPHGYKMIGGAA